MLAKIRRVLSQGVSVGAVAVWIAAALAWPYLRWPFIGVVALKIAGAAWYGSAAAWLAAAGWVIAYAAANIFVAEYKPRNFSR